VLTRYGHTTFGRWDGIKTRLLRNSFGGLAVNRLPAALRKVMVQLGIFHPVRQCRWSPHGWGVRDWYII
jgi:hypothetical protein